MKVDAIENRFGRLTGWNNVRAAAMGRTFEGITEIAYDDEVEKDVAPGAGRMPVGTEEKGYKATGSITLYKEESDILERSIPRGKRFQDIAPFDIIVAYMSKDGSIMTDILRQCEFVKRGVETKTGEGKIAYKYDLLVPYIDWNVA